MEKFPTGPGIYTPDGRLSQVEYAMEAVDASNNLIAIKTQNGFVIGAEMKNETDVEGDKKYPRNIFLIDKHVMIGVSGNIPDSQIIVNHVRKQTQQYKFIYQDDLPVIDIAKEISNIMQQFSQSRASRPMGCSLVIAGWDRSLGFQLIKIDSSGAFAGWKAISIGSNSTTNQIILNDEYLNEMELSDAIGLLIKMFKKKSTYTFSPKIFDIHTCILDHEKNILFHRLSKKELCSLTKS
jgi:20S proteasome alpha/beta subunit